MFCQNIAVHFPHSLFGLLSADLLDEMEIILFVSVLLQYSAHPLASERGQPLPGPVHVRQLNPIYVNESTYLRWPFFIVCVCIYMYEYDAVSSGKSPDWISLVKTNSWELIVVSVEGLWKNVLWEK